METNCFLSLKNKSQNFFISIPDPENENSFIFVYLTNVGNNKINVDLVNNTPFIKLKINLNGNIVSMKDNSNYLNYDLLDSISNECNNYLKMNFLKFLYKTSIDYSSDICDFGEYALSKFKTTKDFEEYNWLGNYKNSVFDVEINTSLDTSLLINQT